MRARGAPLVLVLAVALAGCGGSKQKASQDPPRSGRQAMKAFTDCLRGQGVTAPGRGGSGPPTGRLSAKQRKAFAKCRSKLPQGFGPGGGGPPPGGVPPGGAPYGAPPGDPSQVQ